MPSSESQSQAPPAGRSVHARPRRSVLALGIVLVLAVYVTGCPSLDAPWLQGDEHIFIVRNPEVTGAGLQDDSLWRRIKLIFGFPPQEDLYQPLPILTYAVEWTLWGDAPEALRRTDVSLHALNALLLWWLLRLLLARADVNGSRGPLLALSWSLALLWALHPVVANTYAADMGRTHLLSATFALLSLGLHLRFLQSGRRWLLAGALLALLAAMLCKAIAGWILLVFILEAALLGWQAALRSWRLYFIGVVCLGFAILTYWTSQRSGLVQDAAAGLFGDPVSRSALAVWIYVRNLVAPFWIAPWYLPDPRTTWANPLVWVGLCLAAASVAHAASAWRRAEQRGITVGWAWCWAALLPVIGLVGAREAAAVDRYLYQPLMGLLLVIGTALLRWMSRLRLGPAPASTRPILFIAGLLGAALLLWDLPHVTMYRSTIRRARRNVALNPGDPRPLEGLAAAYDFASNHRVPEADLSLVPAGKTQYEHFLRQCLATLRQAASAEHLEYYFPGPEDRAPFHRRLSHMFKMTRAYEDSLEQAQKARELEPEAFFTWLRLAHAYHGLRRWGQAIEAYNRTEELLPDAPLTRATHFTDFGYLLLFDLERAAAAYPKFQAAVATDRAPTLAQIGLARCEVRVGQGARGLEIISRVLAAEPQNTLAGLVLAEYHLRSRHLAEAADVYAALVASYPDAYQRFGWYYEALRGYQSACAQLGRWRDAALAWDQAARLHPGGREFRSFRVWAIACDGDEDTAAWADDLLAEDANNPLACLAHMLRAIREEQVAAAVDWVRRARRGVPIARAREFERAAAVLTLLSERDELAPEAAIVKAAIHLAAGRREMARAALGEFSAKHPASRWQDVVEQLDRQISDGSEP